MSRQRFVMARLIGAALALGPAVAGAQLANVSNAATGLSGAYTARAQGYNAVFWNPANLGMPGNQGFSFALAGVDGNAGIKPIDFQHLVDAGDTLTKAVREQWMKEVESNGGQSGGFGGGITALGLSMGPIAFQFNTKVAADMNLAPGAVEALLFGNKQRYDSVRTLSLAGSRLQSSAYSTAAVSYGRRLSLVPLPDFAIGVTAKYTVGHALLLASDVGSAIGSNDVSVNFPAVLPDTSSLQDGQAGSGVGIDLGAAWRVPGFRFGVSLQNVVNTFKWDTTKFVSRNAVGMFSADTNFFNADSVDKPYANAPAALRETVAGLKFKPVIAAGLSFDWLPMVTVSADIRQQVGDGIELGPQSMIAAGAELKLIPFIPLRGGVQMMSGGFGVSGGFGLHILGFEAGVGGFVRKRDGGSESGFTLNAISIRP